MCPMEFSIARTSDILSRCGRERHELEGVDTDRDIRILERRAREVVLRLLAKEAERIAVDMIEVDNPSAKNLYKHLEGLAAVESKIRRTEARSLGKRIGRRDPTIHDEELERRVDRGVAREIEARGLDPELVESALSDLVSDALYQEYCEYLEDENWRSEGALLAVAAPLFEQIDRCVERLQKLETGGGSSKEHLSKARRELDYYTSVRKLLQIERPSD